MKSQYPRRHILAAAIAGLWAGPAAAACLAVDQSGLYGGWINYCNVWISVLWNDQKYCASTGNSAFPCAETVGPNDRISAHTYGYVNWQECQSPGGQFDILAIEESYGQVYCKD